MTQTKLRLEQIEDADFSLWVPDAPPVSPSACDDEFDDASFDTGLWTEFDPASKLAVSEGEVGLILDQDTAAGDNWAGVYQSIPSGDFCITTKLSTICLLFNIAIVGLVLWEDATNVNAGLYALVLQWNPAAYYGRVAFHRMNNYGSWNSTPIEIYDQIFTHLYVRIRRIGSTYYCDFSSNGIGWVQIWTGSLAFTPGHFGLGINNINQEITIRAIHSFFRYTNSGALIQILEGDRIGGWRAA